MFNHTELRKLDKIVKLFKLTFSWCISAGVQIEDFLQSDFGGFLPVGCLLYSCVVFFRRSYIFSFSCVLTVHNVF